MEPFVSDFCPGRLQMAPPSRDIEIAISQPNVTIFHIYILHYTAKALMEPFFKNFAQGTFQWHLLQEILKLLFLGYFSTKCNHIFTYTSSVIVP